MKDFLLIANTNACTYKEFFPLLKEGKVKGGYNFNKTLMFETPEGGLKSGPNIAWFVTLPTPGKKKLTLTKSYTQEEYPKYCNYDAIEVGRIKDIPYDYNGVMGVPITIFGYDLDNVVIVGSGAADDLPAGYKLMSKEFVDLYYSQGGTGQYQEGKRLEHYIKNGQAKVPYARVLIRLTRRKNRFQKIL